MRISDLANNLMKLWPPRDEVAGNNNGLFYDRKRPWTSASIEVPENAFGTNLFWISWLETGLQKGKKNIVC